MGWHEWGQSIVGILIMVSLLLVSFGGYPNQDLYESFLPDGVSGPTDVNNSNVLVSSTQLTPYATGSSGNTPSQLNNPFLSAIVDPLSATLKLITELPGAAIDILTYMGLPPQISFIFIAFIAVAIVFLSIYFLATAGVGALVGIGK